MSYVTPEQITQAKEGYTLDEIKERILHNLQKQVPFPEAVHRPPRRYRVRGKPRKKITGLRALYFRYCYELHIIVKRPASVKRVSFLLREDIAKLDRLDAETRFLGKQHISTIDKLLATMRSREISVSIIIQNLAQLKALFEKQWESIVGNCDEFIYLGGNEQATHEYVSKLLGKETIDTVRPDRALSKVA